MKKSDVLWNLSGTLFLIIPAILLYCGIGILYFLGIVVAPVYLLIANISLDKKRKSKYPVWRILPCLVSLFLGSIFVCFIAYISGEAKMAALIVIQFFIFLGESAIIIIGLLIYQLVTSISLYRNNKKSVVDY